MVWSDGMHHIFVIDDEFEIRQLIVKYLEKEGYKTTDFSNGEGLIAEIRRLKPDLLVMDIMMPGSDGLELCRNIRQSSDVPIIFVSARGEEIDRIIGLEMGADDYLSKPFSPRELLVRIKNIFRRLEQAVQQTPVRTYVIKDCQLFSEQRTFTIDSQDVNLTAKEFDTLHCLMENVNVPLTREQLLEKVWGYDYFGEERIVDDVIKRIRKKLKDRASDMTITTVWGYGYKIENENK